MDLMTRKKGSGTVISDQAYVHIDDDDDVMGFNEVGVGLGLLFSSLWDRDPAEERIKRHFGVTTLQEEHDEFETGLWTLAVDAMVTEAQIAVDHERARLRTLRKEGAKQLPNKLEVYTWADLSTLIESKGFDPSIKVLESPSGAYMLYGIDYFLPGMRMPEAMVINKRFKLISVLTHPDITHKLKKDGDKAQAALFQALAAAARDQLVKDAEDGTYRNWNDYSADIPRWMEPGLASMEYIQSRWPEAKCYLHLSNSMKADLLLLNGQGVKETRQKYMDIYNLDENFKGAFERDFYLNQSGARIYRLILWCPASNEGEIMKWFEQGILDTMRNKGNKPYWCATFILTTGEYPYVTHEEMDDFYWHRWLSGRCEVAALVKPIEFWMDVDRPVLPGFSKPNHFVKMHFAITLENWPGGCEPIRSLHQLSSILTLEIGPVIRIDVEADDPQAIQNITAALTDFHPDGVIGVDYEPHRSLGNTREQPRVFFQVFLTDEASDILIMATIITLRQLYVLRDAMIAEEKIFINPEALIMSCTSMSAFVPYSDFYYQATPINRKQVLFTTEESKAAWSAIITEHQREQPTNLLIRVTKRKKVAEEGNFGSTTWAEFRGVQAVALRKQVRLVAQRAKEQLHDPALSNFAMLRMEHAPAIPAFKLHIITKQLADLTGVRLEVIEKKADRKFGRAQILYPLDS